MGKPVGELTYSEKRAYVNAHNLAMRILLETISKLEAQRLATDDAHEKSQIAEKLLDLAGDKALMKARMALFHAQNSMVISPPSTEQLVELGKLMDEVEQLVINDALFNAALNTLTKGLEIYRTIDGGGPATTAGSGGGDD